MAARIDANTEDLRLFVRCVTEGSLSAAARAMKLSQTVATRRIQRLEAAIGAKLLYRTTRALRLTAEGARLLPAAQRIIAELSAVEFAHRSARHAPSGVVHVSAPVLLGQEMGAALALELAQKHPALRLRLSLSNKRADLLRDDVDVALRVGALPDTTLLATRIATAHVGAYSADKVARRAVHPSELDVARWLGLPADDPLQAYGPSGARWSSGVRFALECDDRTVLRRAAIAGMGTALLPTFVGEREPLLWRVAPEWHFGAVPIHALWLPEARGDPRVRAVIDVVLSWGQSQAW